SPLARCKEEPGPICGDWPSQRATKVPHPFLLIVRCETSTPERVIKVIAVKSLSCTSCLHDPMKHVTAFLGNNVHIGAPAPRLSIASAGFEHGFLCVKISDVQSAPVAPCGTDRLDSVD